MVLNYTPVRLVDRLIYPTIDWLACLGIIILLTEMLRVALDPQSDLTPYARFLGGTVAAVGLCGATWMWIGLFWRGGALYRGRVRRVLIACSAGEHACVGPLRLKPSDVVMVWAITRKPPSRASMLSIELVDAEGSNLCARDIIVAAPAWLFRTRRRRPERAALMPHLDCRNVLLRVRAVHGSEDVSIKLCYVASPSLARLCARLAAGRSCGGA